VDEDVVLERLVRAYSPSGSERAAVREFTRVGRALGYSVRTDGAGNGVARIGRGRPHVVYLGHIDTVDGRLVVRRRSGRLYGRGTVDAKGPLAAALVAGPRAEGPGTFTVVAAVGEETDSRGARYLMSRLAPDAVIAGEPSGWDGITVGYKGDLQVKVSLKGRRTHYSYPEPTAADRAWEWIGSARSIAAARTSESPFRSLTCKLVEFTAGHVGDSETAKATVDFRIPPGLSTRGLIGLLPRADEGPAVRIRLEPLEVDRTNPVVASLVEGVRAVGGRPTLWKKGGTSDLNLVVPAWKVPGAAYGPGEARLDHTDRESVALAELSRAVEVLRVALTRLRSGAITPRQSAGGV